MCPTIVNNVETLCNVKHIVDMGAVAFTKIGTPNNTGTRLVSLSGDVKNPGYFEIETGKVTLGELIHDENFGGGMRNNNTLQAIIPGGSSSKVLKAGETFKIGDDELALLDVPYDFDTLQKIDTMSGSGAIIVIDDTRDIVECLANLAKFYAHESCGQCTPCREGSLWMDKALHRMTHGEGRKEDAEYLLNIAQNIQGRTICAFGEACAWPVLSFVNKFRDEFEAKAEIKTDKETATA
jgi:NADH-quinone oxidoreductase subunit F